MNETLGHRPATDLPPILPPQPAGTPSPTTLDRVYAALRRLPARPTDRAVLGGVCATVADRLAVSAVVVRVLAVLSVLLAGVGVGLYLIAWTLLPDPSGRTHLEQGLRHGRGRSVLVLALGTVSALGALAGGLSFLASILPGVAGLAALALIGWLVWALATDRGRASS